MATRSSLAAFLRRAYLGLCASGWLSFVTAAALPHSQRARIGLSSDSGAWFLFFCLVTLLAGITAIEPPWWRTVGPLAAALVVYVAAPTAVILLVVAVPLTLLGGDQPDGLNTIAQAWLALEFFGAPFAFSLPPTCWTVSRTRARRLSKQRGASGA